MYKVTITPSLQSIQIKEGETLLEACQRQEVPVGTSCGGFGTCAKCVVKITYGEENVTPITAQEKKVLGNVFHLTRERLSCQLYATGDLGIEIPEANKTIKKVQTVKREKGFKKEFKKDDRPPKERKDRRPRAFRYSEEEE